MNKKKIYLTLDTETFGGFKPKGFYHIAGIIHDRNGDVYDEFNYVVAQDLQSVAQDDFARNKFYKYVSMVGYQEAQLVETEEIAIELIKQKLDEYNVKTCMAYNAQFDYTRTKARELLEGREFIDIYLMALETLATKNYQRYCHKHDKKTNSGKYCSCTAETMYGYILGNPDYVEDHTAYEDALIELEIFKKCIKTHKKFTQNEYFNNRFSKLPKF